MVSSHLQKKSEHVPPNAEEMFILNLSHGIEKEGGSQLEEPVMTDTAAQRKGQEHTLPNKDVATYKSLPK